MLLLHPLVFRLSCFHFHLSLGVFWFLQWSIGGFLAYCLASTWFYHSCAPPTFSLWLLLCLRRMSFLGRFQNIFLIDGCSAVSSDFVVLCEKVSSNPSTPVSCPELRDFYKYGCLLPISSVCAGCYPFGIGCVFVMVLPHSQDSGCHALAICFHFSWENIKSIMAGLYGSYMF